MTDNTNALAPVATLPSPQEWGTIFDMAKALVPTGFLPDTIKRPEQAAAIMLKGRELGVPPMEALGSIHVIKGKPRASAALMMALVKRAYGRDAIWIESSTDAEAKVGYLVHGKPKFYSFTIEMARKAGLTGGNWNSYPGAMLRARAVSAVCTMEFPEVVAGMYVPGETGDPVTVDPETGEVMVATLGDWPEGTSPEEADFRRSEASGGPESAGSSSKGQHTYPAVSGRVNGSEKSTGPIPAEPDVLDTIADDLKEHIATVMWKKESWEAMSSSDRTKVRAFLNGKGPKDKQTAFDQFVADYLDVDEDDVIEGEIVGQQGMDGLNPDENELPNPAQWTR